MRLIIGILAVLGLQACGAAQDGVNAGVSATLRIPEEIAKAEWSLTPEATAAGIPAGYGHQIAIQNRFNGNWIRYLPQDYGINIGWIVARAGEFTFHRESGVAGPIRYGERLALHNATGGFIVYGSREYGINLVWSATPKYEWIVKADIVGTVGANPVGLFNTVANDYVVRCQRDYGTALKWAHDCRR